MKKINCPMCGCEGYLLEVGEVLLCNKTDCGYKITKTKMAEVQDEFKRHFKTQEAFNKFFGYNYKGGKK